MRLPWRLPAVGAMTVAGLINLALGTVAVVVLAGSVAGALLLDHTDDKTHEVLDAIGPARVAAYVIQSAVRDQETGVRGYAISADPQFLAPYISGVAAQRQAADDIGRLMGDQRVLIDLEAVQSAVQDWRRTYAEPVIDGVRPGRPGPIDPALLTDGRARFDHIRTLFDTQNRDLTAARDAAVDELNATNRWRNGLMIALLVVFVGTMVGLRRLVHRTITAPLSALARKCRRITAGDFDTPISVRGPRDVRSIATDVDDMRRRIIAELGAAQAARTQLAGQAVELRRSNAELEQFAYVASHDLQEPLRKVASFCQLLEKRYGEQLDVRGKEYIGFAVDGAKRMQVLINDLLAFSRVGRFNTRQTAVDLDAALDAALANLDSALEESGAVVRRPATLPTVPGDPTLLAMLWQNLVGNAIKFAAPGVVPQVQVEILGPEDAPAPAGTESVAPVELGAAAAPVAVWRLRVSDNGIGIEAEFAEKVFVIFQRLHSREAYGGTGIGLALCRKIVEYHGGAIAIDTGFTGGTRFEFTLPVDLPVGSAAPDRTDELEGSTS